MMSNKGTALDIINNSAYNEFPDIIATIQLSMHFAKADFRNVQEAMRFTARACMNRADNQHLRRTLQEMSVSTTPEMEMANLYLCQLKMRDELATAIKDTTIRTRDLKQLRSK
jgi:hypothetical protein